MQREWSSHVRSSDFQHTSNGITRRCCNYTGICPHRKTYYSAFSYRKLQTHLKCIHSCRVGLFAIWLSTNWLENGSVVKLLQSDMLKLTIAETLKLNASLLNFREGNICKTVTMQAHCESCIHLGDLWKYVFMVLVFFFLNQQVFFSIKINWG